MDQFSLENPISSVLKKYCMTFRVSYGERKNFKGKCFITHLILAKSNGNLYATPVLNDFEHD